MATIRKIAIDIDDVVAHTSEAVRLWANQKANVALTAEHYYTDDPYWSYYNNIWQRHGLADVLSFHDFHQTWAVDQSSIGLIGGAREAVHHLYQKYDVVFITSRLPSLQDTTVQWLKQQLDLEIPVYISHSPSLETPALSKGELCADLGIDLLIDDNVDNCKDAIAYGTEAVLFGAYGWNEKAEGLRRCVTWSEVREYINGHAN